MQIKTASFWTKGLIGLLVCLILGLYLYGAIHHAQRVNLDVSKVDQRAYLEYAKNLYETNYNYVGGRNRMPVYSFLQSLIYSPDLTEYEYFTRGKYFNIALSVIFLPCFFGVFQSYLSCLPALNLLLITAFTVFIFKAGYFQTELLFYFLNFCSFLLMTRMLVKPSWWLGIGTGIVIGITHLTKASILPGLALFSLFFLLQSVTSFYQSKTQPFRWKKLIGQGLSLVLVIACFLTTIYPYISTSKRIFGHYFYNVNSTFYIWYDSWEEAEQGTRSYGDGKGWPDMPAEEIPSLQKYISEHSPSQILDRFWDGLDELLSVAIGSYGYFKYLMIYGAIALLTTCFNFRNSIGLIKTHFILVLFGLAYFTSYLLLYAWYTPIAGGERFPLAQFVPFLFSMAMVTSVQFNEYSSIQIGKYQIHWFYLLNLAILGMILIELYPILTYRIITLFAGT